MADDLCNDCDCGDCDLDCCDCDCTCDDCFPGGNVFILFLCIPPTKTNEASRANRGDAPLDGCCFCCHGRRSTPPRQPHGKRRKKKGCCWWRLWCCCARNEPSPPPSPPPPPPRRDGRYPMPEDLDLYMNDMPPKAGMKYPAPQEMRMYRDKYYGHRGRWDDSRDEEKRRDHYRSNERYGRRNDAQFVSSTNTNDIRKPASHHHLKNVSSLHLINENIARNGHLDYDKGDDHKTHEYAKPHQHQLLPTRWSTPTKYEQS